MTTKTHQQAFGNYPENFDKREARLIACGYSQLTVAATETYTMASDDSFTHVIMQGTSGTTTLLLPLAAASLGRVININVTAAAGTVAIKDSTGTAVVAAAGVGSLSFYCNGTSWLASGPLFPAAKTSTVAATETLTMTATDGITHVSIGAASGTATIKLPLIASSYSRIVNIYVTDTTGTVALQDSTGGTVVADLAAGSYSYVCNGTAWVRFF